MKKLLIIILFVISTSVSHGQKNSVYTEVSSSIVANSLSVNYERKLFNELDLYLRVGFGFYKGIVILGVSEDYYSIPITVNYLFNVSDRSAIDVGIGPNIIESSFDSPGAPKNVTYLFTNIGYRQRFAKKMFWRVHVTPYVLNLTSSTYSYGDENFLTVEEFDFPTTWVGFSVGIQF